MMFSSVDGDDVMGGCSLDLVGLRDVHWMNKQHDCHHHGVHEVLQHLGSSELIGTSTTGRRPKLDGFDRFVL
jgi:hypothetical protein